MFRQTGPYMCLCGVLRCAQVEPQDSVDDYAELARRLEALKQR